MWCSLVRVDFDLADVFSWLINKGELAGCRHCGWLGGWGWEWGRGVAVLF